MLGMQVPQAQLDAHFHAVHLIAIVAKLLPDWLPQSLFDLLLRQWNSPERHSRHAFLTPALCSLLPVLGSQQVFPVFPLEVFFLASP